MRAPPTEIPVDGLQLHPPQPRYVRLRCPNCRSKNLRLTEIWESAISWAVTDGWMDLANGNLGENGPKHVEANCKDCDHWWRPRNGHQINHVLEDE